MSAPLLSFFIVSRRCSEPQQLKGKRMRDDAVNAVAHRPKTQSFWYESMMLCTSVKMNHEKIFPSH